MTAELGVFFLIVALLAALLQTASLVPALRTQLSPCLLPAAWVQSLAITLAFAILMLLRLDSDFSVANVIAHSNLSLPTLYKIVGTWGNHEGSMLLWVLVLALFGLALAIHSAPLDSIKKSALAIQSAICAGFLFFILFTSNPFERRFPPLVDGEALNPLLQDIALAMHPPLLYLGYVGFSIVYSLAVAGLLFPPPLWGRVREGGIYQHIRLLRVTPHPALPHKGGGNMQEWAHIVHPWILLSWSALTLGIGLGSWWAYRELGWGGWWFWDPVENASLLPWLSGTALLHSNIVLKKRGMLAQWVLLLAIITFGLSLLGTFLVRSGALTSVHGFASDPARGLFILVYMVIVIGGALLLFALRAGKIASPDAMQPVSREGVIVINNLFLLCACATVLLGTIYPLFIEWFDDTRLSVGPPYFNATFIPMIIIPLLFAGLAPLMPWKNASFRNAFTRATPALLAALAALLLILAIAKTEIIFAAFGFGLAAWLAASSIQWLLQTSAKNIWPVFISHLGVAIIIMGITGTSLWKETREQAMMDGNTLDIAGYHLIFKHQPSQRGANYTATRAELEISRAGKPLTTLSPEYRLYDIKHTTTSEADIYSNWAGDLYAVIGESSADGRHTALRIYFVPMIRFIWLGFVLMALGGLLSILQPSRKTP